MRCVAFAGSEQTGHVGSCSKVSSTHLWIDISDRRTDECNVEYVRGAKEVPALQSAARVTWTCEADRTSELDTDRPPVRGLG